MFEAIAVIFAVALVAALLVPIAIVVLARLGQFDPVRFEMFGRTWRFAPPEHLVERSGSTPVLMFPPTRGTTPTSISARLMVAGLPRPSPSRALPLAVREGTIARTVVVAIDK